MTKATKTKRPGGGFQAVCWWVGWITLTIVTFFISCYFWTRWIAEHVGPMGQPGVPLLWVAAVFGTWMVFLVPLIIVMYAKVDKAYEDARLARESAAHQKAKERFQIRSLYIGEERRRLSRPVTEKLKKVRPAIKRGHLVTATLLDGRRIPHVFVIDRKSILGVYDAKDFTFEGRDVVDVEPADLDKLPSFESERWLRLDGVGG